MRAAAAAPDTAAGPCPPSSSEATGSKPPRKTVGSRRSCKTPPPPLQIRNLSPSRRGSVSDLRRVKVSNSEYLWCGDPFRKISPDKWAVPSDGFLRRERLRKDGRVDSQPSKTGRPDKAAFHTQQSGTSNLTIISGCGPQMCQKDNKGCGHVFILMTELHKSLRNVKCGTETRFFSPSL